MIDVCKARGVCGRKPSVSLRETPGFRVLCLVSTETRVSTRILFSPSGAARSGARDSGRF